MSTTRIHTPTGESPASPAALHELAENGFFVWPDAIPQETCEALTGALSAAILRVAEELLSGRRKKRSFWELMPASAFATEVFFDETAGPLSALAAPDWESRAMRVGHGLHLVEPLFRDLCARPEITTPLRRFTHLAALLSSGMEAAQAARRAFEPTSVAQLIQSAVIYKQPMSDIVQFGFHRDAAYLPNEPESLILAFIALDAMTIENGCLRVIPGTHTDELGLRLRLGPEGFVPVGREPRPAEEKSVALPMSRGSIAFVHGRIQHASEPNRSTGPRRALIVHAISEASSLTDGAWLSAPPSGFVRIS